MIHDYEVSNIEGTFDLLNTLVDKKDIIVSGQKIWVDNDNQYNTRPESIVVTLYADGKEINSQVVSAIKIGNMNLMVYLNMIKMVKQLYIQ